VAITDILQLKPTLQLLWRNDPALTQVELVDASGVPTGDMVLTPLQELDTVFTLALVVKM
jgi:hypothetical protein